MKYKKTLFWEIKDNTITESKKYTSRTDFYKGSHGAYCVAKEKGWLDEMTWLNRQNVYNDPVDVVYKYHFVNKNAIYIGRTIYLELRDRQHRTRKTDTVYRFAQEHNAEIPAIEIIESGLTVTEGAQREGYWAKYYADNGLKLINKQPCGSLGYMAKGKWSKHKCFEEAKKYKSRSEFQRNSRQAYRLSIKNGWIEEMDWMPKNNSKPSGHWNTKENIIEEAKKYTKLKDFQKHSGGAFNAARRLGVIDELTWLEKETRLPNSYWKDKERVMEEAKKYTSKIEFQKGNQSAYWAALKYGYLEEMPWLVKRKVMPRNFLKKREWIMNEAKKYKTREEFQNNNVRAYSVAKKNGWLDEMDWFEKPKERQPRGYWQNKDHVIEESKKFSSRTEFKKKSQNAYNSALKNNWIDEMVWLDRVDGKHPKGYWKNEKNIMHEAKKYSSKEEFKEKNLTAFLMSYRYGFNEKMDWLVKQKQHKKGYWTYETIEKEAFKYNTKTDFFKGNQTAYRAALKLGIIDDFFMMNDYVAQEK